MRLGETIRPKIERVFEVGGNAKNLDIKMTARKGVDDGMISLICPHCKGILLGRIQVETKMPDLR